MGTKFSVVYNRFLNKITDDMYLELTPQDTLKDLQNLLINSLSEFEFPRKNILDYTISIAEKLESEASVNDFIIPTSNNKLMIDSSYFNCELSEEEVNIIAILMVCAWTQRQITSIENTRMKYSGTDFKFTSQANHLSKLLSLLGEMQRQSRHLQRLYKRRKINDDGIYESNWGVFKSTKNTSTYFLKSENKDS